MNTPLAALTPIITYFMIGLLLRWFGVAGREQAAFLLRLVFYVTLPALVFSSVAGTAISRQTVLLPVAGILVNLVCAAAAFFYVRAAHLDNRRAGVVVLGAGVMNMMFSYPFILAILGEAAFADAVLFDLGNSIFFSIGTYSIAMYFGNAAADSTLTNVLRTIRTPIFIAVVAALVVSAGQMQVPAIATSLLSPLAAATTPLVLVAIGMTFSTKGVSGRLAMITILLRMLLGLVVGIVIAWLFRFEGLTAAVVAVSAAAPIGFNTVALASIGNLDTEQAASSLSVSVAVGVVSTTLLLFFAAHWVAA